MGVKETREEKWEKQMGKRKGEVGEVKWGERGERKWKM
jgi:hypothetical protein